MSVSSKASKFGAMTVARSVYTQRMSMNFTIIED